MEVYVELGQKRTFAVAREWPGWARAGRDEEAALMTLLAYGVRYRSALGKLAADLAPPTSPSAIEVVERLAGNATTDFGAPGVIPHLDRAPLDRAGLDRLLAIHAACWAAFRRQAAGAAGRTLAPAGPRGGGRSLDKIVAHVDEAEAAYAGAVGDRSDFVSAVRRRNAGELPGRGPRGGERWPARYAVRRSTWHLLDHAWEIEDRLSAA